ncbi:Hypothetical predicted protein [Paramuricea clavata]|uniref:Uncharacterized protein n=1 Tax=Paramuricea clavata TaxID=317549 RepID=A0A6S7GN23_PARCT|nr:Hypothetical predicted protein [Paramuricea clavata]
MSQSSLQLLLHAGELEYIVKTIRASLNKNDRFVGGCLFGLWRNSLKQPVIQFVTGPGENFDDSRGIKNMFSSKHVESCATIMMEKHCLLHLGFWFYGREEEDQKKAESMVFTSGPKYNVLLFINYEEARGESLGGEYLLRKGRMEESSPLFREDVLPDHSSFRKFKALTTEINSKGDKVSPVHDGRPVRQNAANLIENLPSRVQVEEAVTSDKQWYATGEGMEFLQLLFQYFQGADITPDMSRDTVTQDMQFGLSGGYCLDFPANFPKKMPTLRAADGSRHEFKRRSNSDEDVCKTVVQAVVDFLRNPPQSSRYGGRHTSGGRGGNNY